MYSEKLLRWYSEYGRSLPWRGIDNPYFIWLSEIILQQTRIEQGRGYYERFTREYPTVRHLAEATEEQVLKNWQGLGYYSRARNLHKAARKVAFDMDGRFPDTYEGILALPGVGRYTAAAIASFAYRLPYPVIDGNVYRVVARQYGLYTPIGTDAAYKEFEKLLNHLIDRRRPDLFNQAIMDFGSIYCKPANPDCRNCVFRQECVAFRKGKVDQLPVRMKRTEVKRRYFYYFDIRWQKEGQEYVLVRRRGEGDVWQGLYDFPLLETETSVATSRKLKRFAAQLQEWTGREADKVELGPTLQHQLTHRTIVAQFVRVVYAEEPMQMPPQSKAIEAKELKYLPISRLMDRYLHGL